MPAGLGTVRRPTWPTGHDGRHRIEVMMTGFHLPLPDGDDRRPGYPGNDRLARLRFISAQARERYRSVPGLAGVA
ncbi:hypothetical protein QR78_31645, partial [Methylobacterium indicum]